MTSERSRAYGRVMETLAAMGPSRLQRREREVVREAADALLFADPSTPDEDVLDAVAHLYELAMRLAASERWRPGAAEQLVHDVEACGPVVVAVPALELATA